MTTTTTAAGGGGSTGASGSAGAGGAAGSGGAAGASKDASVTDAIAISDGPADDGPTYDQCDDCIVAQCAVEFDECVAEPICLAPNANAPKGQYDLVVDCVDMKRVTQPVKRADFRDCGVQVVNQFGTLWPPIGMHDTTTNLMNCIANGPTDVPDKSSWANSANINSPWPLRSCAKLACTAKL
ncbi:MAG TPA: hypothetical protein VJT73_02370 [Polyangiaceae bacterium]|nr:hypothetical protein [Polyangiaceae bacterium]